MLKIPTKTAKALFSSNVSTCTSTPTRAHSTHQNYTEIKYQTPNQSRCAFMGRGNDDFWAGQAGRHNFYGAVYYTNTKYRHKQKHVMVQFRFVYGLTVSEKRG